MLCVREMLLCLWHLVGLWEGEEMVWWCVYLWAGGCCGSRLVGIVLGLRELVGVGRRWLVSCGRVGGGGDFLWR